MGSIGRQSTEHVEGAARVPEDLVDVPRAVGVAARAGDAAGLLLGRGRGHVGGRGVDLLAGGQAGVVAVQPAVDVARAPEVVVGEAPVDGHLEGVVLPLRLRHGEADRGGAGGELHRGQAAARVADDVRLVAAGVHGADVLDGLRQVVVDVVHAERQVRAELVLGADAGAVLVHRPDVGVGRVEVGHAAIAEVARHDPEIGPRHVGQVEAADVGGLESAIEDLPGVAAVAAPRQFVLGPVVVAAPAAIELETAIATDVVTGAEPGRQLVAEAELHGRDAVAERGHLLLFGAQAEVEGESVAHRPLVLDVQRVDAGAGLALHATVVDLVVAVRAAAAIALEVEVAIPEDVDEAARVVLVGVVDGVLPPEAGLETVGAAGGEGRVVVGVDEAALRRVVLDDQRARRVLRADRPLHVGRHARQADARRLVDVVGRVGDAGVLVVVAEVAAADRQERGAGQCHVDVAGRVDLLAAEAALEVDAVGRERTGDDVAGRAVVGRQRAFRRGRREQQRGRRRDAAGAPGQLAERLRVGLRALDLAGLGAVVEQVRVGPVGEPRRVRREEEQAIAQDRAADRAADLVPVIGLLAVLHVAHRLVVRRVEHQPLDGAGAERRSLVVVVRLAAERVATGLGHRADHAAKRATVLGADPGGLDLHFLQEFEHRVLARATVD